MPHADRRAAPPRRNAAPPSQSPSQPPSRPPPEYRPGPLTPAQLRFLTTYKYAAEDRSVLYTYVLNPMYNRATVLLPLWLAPNAVTLLGFFFPVLAHVLLLFFSPRLEDAVPRPLYLFAGLSLLTYMVLDNLDGKQARRTGASSPLGHLFDHGCDALNVTVSGVSLLATVRLSDPLAAFATLYGPGFFIFYTSTLEELHTGRLVLREFNGATEGLIFLSGVHLTTYFLGPDVWERPLTNLAPTLAAMLPRALAVLPLKRAVACYALPATLYSVVPSLAVMANHLRTKGNRSTPAIVATLVAQILPVVVLGAALCLWTALAEHAVRPRPAVAYWLAGVAAYDVITRIMLARLANAPFPYAPPSLLALCACAALSIGAVRAPMHARWAAAWNALGPECTLGVVAAGMAWRTSRVIDQICGFLQIRCLSLRPVVRATGEKTR